MALVVNRYQPLVKAMASLTGPFLYLIALFKAQFGGANKIALGFTFTPPSIAAQLGVAKKLAASIQAAISAGLTPPSFSIGFRAIVSLKAFIDKVNLLIGIGGQAQVMIYEGAPSGLGAALQGTAGAGLPLGGGSPAFAVTLLVSESDSGAVTALKGLFGSVASPLPASAVVSFKAALAILLGPLGLLIGLLGLQLVPVLLVQPTLALQLPTFGFAAAIVAAIEVNLALILNLALTLPSIAITVDLSLGFFLALQAAIALPLALAGTLQASTQVMAYQGPLSGVGAALQAGAGNAPGAPPLGNTTIFAVTLLVDASDSISLGSVKQVFGIL